MQDSSALSSNTTMKKRGRRRKVPKRLNEKPHPEYEYAINEYYQTVSPHEANDDGRNLYAYDHIDEPIRSGESSQRRKTPTVETVPQPSPPVASMPTTKVATATSAGLEEIQQQIMQQITINNDGAQQQQQQQENHENDSKLPASSRTTVPLQRGIMTPIQEQFTRSGTGSQSVSGDDTVKFAHYSNTYNAYQTPTGKSMIHNNEVQGEIPNSNSRGMTNVPLGGGDGPISPQQQQDPYINTNYDNDLVASSSYVSMPSPQDSMISSVFDIETPMHMLHQQYQQEATMADATYEEFYGDAYVGAPIKYIYPAGYQNMRPRSGPWKLAIFVCLLFTWLSIFIVGHCSDRAEGNNNNKNNYYNNNNAEMDDDTYVIEQRWCGSKMLYSLWVVSMLITGLACAYCSIIGYIFVRDFSVANLRSQPPGMVGKSDYYVTIGQQQQQNNNNNRPPSSPSTSSHNNNNNENNNYYRKTIYQADGTPQYWGEHIYRPTQAAVAITSR